MSKECANDIYEAYRFCLNGQASGKECDDIIKYVEKECSMCNSDLLGADFECKLCLEKSSKCKESTLFRDLLISILILTLIFGITYLLIKKL